MMDISHYGRNACASLNIKSNLLQSKYGRNIIRSFNVTNQKLEANILLHLAPVHVRFQKTVEITRYPDK